MNWLWLIRMTALAYNSLLPSTNHRPWQLRVWSMTYCIVFEPLYSKLSQSHKLFHPETLLAKTMFPLGLPITYQTLRSPRWRRQTLWWGRLRVRRHTTPVPPAARWRNPGAKEPAPRPLPGYHSLDSHSSQSQTCRPHRHLKYKVKYGTWIYVLKSQPRQP